MFNPDFNLYVPTGADLLAELGLDPQAISAVIEDDPCHALSRPRRGVSRAPVRGPLPGNARTGGSVEWRRALGE